MMRKYKSNQDTIFVLLPFFYLEEFLLSASIAACFIIGKLYEDSIIILYVLKSFKKYIKINLILQPFFLKLE